MSKPNIRGTPPEDVERIIGRHVRNHVQAAVTNLRLAMEPLRERTVYHGSPLLKEIEEAHRTAVIANRSAERWKLRTAPQETLAFDGEPGL